jgi:hypothetical protein
MEPTVEPTGTWYQYWTSREAKRGYESIIKKEERREKRRQIFQVITPEGIRMEEEQD